MIYLDYDGDAGQEIAETDFDGTPGVFTPYEQQRIHEHWRGITATFSMFNVGVTTVQPAAGVPTQWIAITNDMITKGGFNGVDIRSRTLAPSGQSGSDWWAEGYSHELSHGFGNWHQASYDELGNKLDEYAPFPMSDPLRAGIMGDGNGTITKWQFGHSSLDAATIQQDMEAIRADLDALPGGGDGFRPDDQTGTSHRHGHGADSCRYNNTRKGWNHRAAHRPGLVVLSPAPAARTTSWSGAIIRRPLT